MNEYLINQLRHGRLKKNLKQSDVTKKTGIKNTTLSNYENGVTEPDIDTFLQLCELYELDFVSIIEEAYGISIPGKNFSIKPSEIEMIKKYRGIDAHGQNIIEMLIDTEWERCNPVIQDTKNVSREKIIEPIFLTKDSKDFNVVKEQSKELKKLMRKNFKELMDVLKFLWSIGYNNKICGADVIAIINGFKVPSWQLYNHMKNYITSNYEIRFPANNNIALLNAAHERTDIEVTEEMKQYDDAFFDDED